MHRLAQFAAASILLAAAPAASQLRVVTTTSNLAAIAAEIGGEALSVRSLTKGASDPHFATARPSMIRRVFRANLLLAIGAELEVGWLPAALQAGRNGGVLPGRPGHLELSQSVHLLEVPSGPVDRAMGDVHATGNPHYLLDPGRGIQAARAIAARLRVVDPANATNYDNGLQQFETEMAAKRAVWRGRMAPLRGKKVIAYHRTFSYLADGFNFRIVDQLAPLPGVAPTAAHIAGLIARIKAERINLLIMAPFYERRSAALLARQTGIRVAVLPHAVGAVEGIGTYAGLFDEIVAALDRAGAI